MTTKQKLFSFPFHLPWNLPPFPSLTQLLLALTKIPFSDSARNLGVILDSNLSTKKHIIKVCQTAYFELKRIHSAGFPLKMQPRLLLPPISSHSLTIATVSSWVHLILSSKLSRKFKTLLQDSFSWNPATTTQHPSRKNCTGFSFQNVLNIRSPVCVSVL